MGKRIAAQSPPVGFVSILSVHDPKLEWKGVPLGKHDEGAMAKIKASQRIEVQSNTVEIKVHE